MSHSGDQNRWVDFQAIKEAVSLEAVLEHYQVKNLRRRRDQLEGCCPVHGGERQDAFQANPARTSFIALPATLRVTWWTSWPRWSGVRYGKRR